MSAYLKDLAERVATSFVSGLATSVALNAYTDLGWKAWLTGMGVSGLVSVVKGLAAKLVGSKTSASLVPTQHNDYG